MAVDSKARKIGASAIETAKLAYAGSGDTLGRLRAAIRNQLARGQTHLTATPWLAPMAWSASRTIYGGERLVSNGYIYTYIVTGIATTSASTGPTSTGDGPITDGTATCYCVGPLTYSSDANAPSYAVSTTNPTLPRAYRPAASTWSSGATTVITNDNWLDVWGNYGSSIGAKIGYVVPGGSNIAMQTCTSAKQFCIAMETNGSSNIDPTIEVNGRLLIDGVITRYSTSGTQYYLITFPTRSEKGRTITVRKPVGSGWPSILGVSCSADGKCWKPEKRPGDLLGMFIGDSYTTGATAQYGEGAYRGLVAHYFAEIGVRRPLQDSVPGTGFVASGTPFTSTTRMGYVISAAPDVIATHCSINDAGQTQATYQAAATTWYTTIRTALPNAVIIIFGSFGAATGVVAYETWMASLVAGWQAAGDNKLFFIPVSGAFEPWITGNGNVSAAGTTPGNADAYIGPDNTHPVFRGSEYLGTRGARETNNMLMVA